jgi:hypothetical protein
VAENVRQVHRDTEKGAPPRGESVQRDHTPEKEDRVAIREIGGEFEIGSSSR